LFFELGILGELAGLRGGEERVIRRCGPKRIREARGEVVGLERFSDSSVISLR
jgi:hypothetical protein